MEPLAYVLITIIICITIECIFKRGITINVHHTHENVTKIPEAPEMDYEDDEDKPPSMDNVLSEIHKFMLGDDN